jgi:hypothetical protein
MTVVVFLPFSFCLLHVSASTFSKLGGLFPKFVATAQLALFSL